LHRRTDNTLQAIPTPHVPPCTNNGSGRTSQDRPGQEAQIFIFISISTCHLPSPQTQVAAAGFVLVVRPTGSLACSITLPAESTLSHLACLQQACKLHNSAVMQSSSLLSPIGECLENTKSHFPTLPLLQPCLTRSPIVSPRGRSVRRYSSIDARDEPACVFFAFPIAMHAALRFSFEKSGKDTPPSISYLHLLL
jgi:hypothetical protein